MARQGSRVERKDSFGSFGSFRSVASFLLHATSKAANGRAAWGGRRHAGAEHSVGRVCHRAADRAHAGEARPTRSRLGRFCSNRNGTASGRSSFAAVPTSHPEPRPAAAGSLLSRAARRPARRPSGWLRRGRRNRHRHATRSRFRCAAAPAAPRGVAGGEAGEGEPVVVRRIRPARGGRARRAWTSPNESGAFCSSRRLRVHSRRST